MKFLVEEKGFSEERIKRGIKKLNDTIKKKPQVSLESFFGRPVRKSVGGPKRKSTSAKRKSYKKKRV
jgi:flap endonuclease-1